MRPALQSETTSVCATTSTALERSESRRVVGSRRLEASTIDEAVVIDQQIEQPGQFAGRGFGGIRLLRSGQKMQAFLGRSHQAIEQRDVEAVQILQSIEHAELRPQVEMKRGMADGSKVDENHVAMRLLQSHGGVDGGRGASRATLGAEESKYSGLACAAETAGTGGTEAGERFEQGLRTGRMIEIFAGAGAHAGNDAGGLRHFAIRENGNLLSGGANQFDGVDGALRDPARGCRR